MEIRYSRVEVLFVRIKVTGDVISRDTFVIRGAYIGYIRGYVDSVQTEMSLRVTTLDVQSEHG